MRCLMALRLEAQISSVVTLLLYAYPWSYSATCLYTYVIPSIPALKDILYHVVSGLFFLAVCLLLLRIFKTMISVYLAFLILQYL